TLTVRDALNPSGDWDLDFLMNNLSADIVSQVLALPAPTDEDGPGNIGWSGTNTHHFTVQSAYSLEHHNCSKVEGDWKSLWKWHGPHHIQTFIWLAAYGRILTNFRRSRWGGGIFPTWPCCGNCHDPISGHDRRTCHY
ncbi:ribonuclease H, partial [Trifolium medium]|nr:ribonuclease H [Trifolium medium]